MNEKIRQLAEQAGIGFYWDSPSIYAPVGEPPVEQALITPEELAKFAELIVRECAKFLDENSGYDDSNNAWHPEPEELLEHFGVSE